MTKPFAPRDKSLSGLLALWLTLCLGCGHDTLAEPLAVSLAAPPNAMPLTGSGVHLTLAIHGSKPFAIQWTKDGQDLPGATTEDLYLFPVARGNAGSYQARVSDGASLVLTAPFILEPVDGSWVVTSPEPSGPGSLAQVLAMAGAAPGLNGIQFQLPPNSAADPKAPATLTLDADLPPITGQVCILGPLAPSLVLDGASLHRPFFVGGGTLILDNFTVAHGLAKGGDGPGGGGGAAGMGGAMFINAGTVSLTRMTFSGNSAVGGSSDLGSDGQNGGGGGFGGDAPAALGNGAGGGLLGSIIGIGVLDPAENASQGGGEGLGDGAGGGAARGGTLSTPVADWVSSLAGGFGGFGAGGGFSVGPDGRGGDGGYPGAGGGGSGGQVTLEDGSQILLPGASIALGGIFGGDGGKGDGLSTPGRGGGGAGMGGALFLRKGSLIMADCTFTGNQALPGDGDPTTPAQGKGGALFIYAADFVGQGPAINLGMLLAQNYSLNTCTNRAQDPAIDPTYDNANFYVPVRPWIPTASDDAAQLRKRRSRERHRLPTATRP